MGIYRNAFIGHVRTLNPNANIDEDAEEFKVVALQLLGFDKHKIPKYKPIRKYSEYYKLETVEPISGIVSDTGIQKALKKTGKQEVKRVA